jgi:hypothetical protein
LPPRTLRCRAGGWQRQENLPERSERTIFGLGPLSSQQNLSAKLSLAHRRDWFAVSNPLLQRRRYLPVFVLGERATRPCPYVPLRRRGHRKLYDHFVVRRFGNCYSVVLAGDKVKGFQFGPGRAETLLCRIEPLRPFLD